MQNRPKFYLFIFIPAASVIVSMVVGEIALAILGFKPLISGLAKSPSDKVMRAGSFRELLDKKLVKSVYGSLKPDEEFGYTTYEGPQGFRDKKDFYADWSKYKRILMLGDSFTGGASADRGKGFVDLLGSHYQDRGIIFFNTGVGGYGINNELAVLKRYCDVIKPDLVILSFYTANDFGDNITPLDRYTALPGKWIHNYETVHCSDGVYIRRRTPEEVFKLYKEYMNDKTRPNSYCSLTEYLKYKFFYKTRIGSLVWLAAHKIRTMSAGPREKDKNRDKETGMTPIRDAYAVTKDCMGRIKGYLAERHIPFYAMLIPDHFSSKDKLTKSGEYSKAVRLFHELSIPYLDMFDHLTLDDYFKSGNDHWNNSGHFKAYEAIKNSGIIEGREDGLTRAPAPETKK